MESMMADPYGPDEFAQEFRCRHGVVTAERSAYGTWTLRFCGRCAGVGATCWLDEDGDHVWFAHACNGEWVEARLVFGRPIGIKGNGGGWCAMQVEPLTVAPSVTCDECGFHKHYIDGSF